MLAVDQDALGLQGLKVAEAVSGQQVWSKTLAPAAGGDGRRAVVLLNRTNSPASITARFSDLGLTGSTGTAVNLWTNASSQISNGAVTATVAAGDSVAILITGAKSTATSIEAENTANTRTGTVTTVACSTCSGGSAVGGLGNGSANRLTVNAIDPGFTGAAHVTIRYVNPDASTRFASLTIATQSTTVAFSPTGNGVGSVVVMVPMLKGSNSIALSAAGVGPVIDAVSVVAVPGATGTFS